MVVKRMSLQSNPLKLESLKSVAPCSLRDCANMCAAPKQLEHANISLRFLEFIEIGQFRTSPNASLPTTPRRGMLKRFWRNVHLWLGVGLFVLLVPIALSGAILVYHDDIDEFLRTPKGAAAPSAPTDLAAAVANAKAAAGAAFQPVNIRIPDDPRTPLAIMLRGQARQQGERPPFLIAHIDRSDARALGVVDSRATFFGFMHSFHENLTIPFYNGRDIVGWGAPRCSRSHSQACTCGGRARASGPVLSHGAASRHLIQSALPHRVLDLLSARADLADGNLSRLAATGPQRAVVDGRNDATAAARRRARRRSADPIPGAVAVGDCQTRNRPAFPDRWT